MGSNLGIEPADLFRLVQMACNIAADRGCSVTEAIDQFETTAGRPMRSPGLLEVIRTAKRYRLKRNQALDASLFRDPAWEMLLDLLLADEDGKPLSVSALCHGSGVAMTTALRHVQRLVDHGFIVRHGDLHDQRRTFLTLVPSKKAELTRFLGDWLRDCMVIGPDAPADRTARAHEPWEAKAKPIPATSHPVFLS
jgi:DNA-binding MarR family transcriptional regulator